MIEPCAIQEPLGKDGWPLVAIEFPRKKNACNTCGGRGYSYGVTIPGVTPLAKDENGRVTAYHRTREIVYFPCDCQMQSDDVRWFVRDGHLHPPEKPLVVLGNAIPNPRQFYAKLIEVSNTPDPRSDEKLVAVRYAKKLHEMFAEKLVEGPAFPETAEPALVEGPAF